MSEQYDVDSTPYVMYGLVTSLYWLLSYTTGLLAYSLGPGLLLGGTRFFFMLGLDWGFNLFMGPISLLWIISLLTESAFGWGFGFFDSWSLAGVFFFNFINLYWFNLWSFPWFGNAFVQIDFWTKSLLLLTHFVVFFMYHSEFVEYYEYIRDVCPTNDCRVGSEEATEEGEETVDGEVVEEETAEDEFFDF